MTVKERLEDAADRLDDLELSELLREAIEEIETAEADALEHEQHGDRVEAELLTASAKVESLQGQLDDLTGADVAHMYRDGEFIGAAESAA